MSDRAELLEEVQSEWQAAVEELERLQDKANELLPDNRQFDIDFAELERVDEKLTDYVAQAYDEETA